MPALYTMTNLGEEQIGPDPDLYLCRFKQQAKECIANAYRMTRTIRTTTSRSINGHDGAGDTILTTSLVEDVFSLIDTQLSVLDNFLSSQFLLSTKQGSLMLIDAIVSMITALRETHENSVVLYLSTFEDCCAAANDWFRMAEKLEALYNEYLCEKYPLLLQPNNHQQHQRQQHQAPHTQQQQPYYANHQSYQQQQQEAEFKMMPFADDDRDLYGRQVEYTITELVQVLNQDAVYAAERVHIFILRSIEQHAVTTDEELFTLTWENECTHNEICLEIIQIVSQALTDVESYLVNEYLYNKVLIVCAKTVVCYYIRCLVEKASGQQKTKRPRRRSNSKSFGSIQRALLRLADDIDIIRTFFHSKTTNQQDQQHPQQPTLANSNNSHSSRSSNNSSSNHCSSSSKNKAVARIISNEIRVLELIHECLEGASTQNITAFESFIVVIHKSIGGCDTLMTRYFVSDLWVLATSGSGRRSIGSILQQPLMVQNNATGGAADNNDPNNTTGSNNNNTQYRDRKHQINETMAILQDDLDMVSKKMNERSDDLLLSTTSAATTSSLSASASNALLENNNETATAAATPDATSTTGSTMTTTVTICPTTMICLSEMLKMIYEERIVKGIVPLLCWSCIPKESTISASSAPATGNSNDGGCDPVAATTTYHRRVRSLTRTIAEMGIQLSATSGTAFRPKASNNSSDNSKKNPRQQQHLRPPPSPKPQQHQQQQKPAVSSISSSSS